jgi:hypothetical protein
VGHLLLVHSDEWRGKFEANVRSQNFVMGGSYLPPFFLLKIWLSLWTIWQIRIALAFANIAFTAFALPQHVFFNLVYSLPKSFIASLLPVFCHKTAIVFLTIAAEFHSCTYS